MQIETTLNIERRILDGITQAAIVTVRTRSNIIRHLFARVIKDHNKLVKSNTGIRYQKRDESNLWHKFHITFRIDEYEHYLDMRKLFKLSLSRILAYAVRQYLSEIIRKLSDKILTKKADNYLIKNYLMLQDSTIGVFCWRLYWGIPPEIEKIF